MRPGTQCLLHALRGEEDACAAGEAEWELAIALADEHRVLPFLAGRLLESGQTLPPKVYVRLTYAAREAMQYSFLQSSELKQLLRSFASAALPVLLLKGPWFAQRIYGAASLRVSCDLDLLVHRVDFPRASLLLQSLGFQPHSIPDDYHQKWRRGTTLIELHFNVENPLAIDFGVERAWRNAHLDYFGGEPAWRLSAPDEVLYLCLHGVRHRFDRLSLIVDLALALTLFSGQNQQPGLCKQRDNLSRFVVLGCALANRLQLQGTSAIGLPGAHKSDSRMEQLAEQLWDDLLTKPAMQQDWASMHRFYLETELTRARRLLRLILHRLILLTRVIDEDFRFAARFGVKRRWQVWLMRPARIVLRRYGASSPGQS